MRQCAVASLCQAQVKSMWAPEETEEGVVPALEEPTIL